MGARKDTQDSTRNQTSEYLAYAATLCLGLVLAVISTGQLGLGPMSTALVLGLYTGFVFFLGISFPYYVQRVRRLIA